MDATLATTGGAARTRTGRPVTLGKTLAFLALVAAVLVTLDLAERFLMYDVRRRDRETFVRAVRRPIKDTLLRTLHGLPGGPEVLPDLPVFDLYLKPDDERALLARLKQVELIGTHDDFTRDRVSGKLEVEGESFDVTVKLRGRQYYHVLPTRPSLRMDVERGRSYRGATTFNLIEPFDKTTDQVFLWESRHHGLAVWDATMGYLALRGEPVALVQYVEQVRRETGDRNGRPEGMFFRGTGELYSEGADPRRTGPVVERVAAWLGDTEGTMPFEEMEELLDLERVCWFTALTELSGDQHGFADFNMKGYCDPVSLKAEFMIWDTRFGDWTQVADSPFGHCGTQLLREPRFRELHDEALWELATERVEPMLERWREFDAAHAEALAADRMYWFPRGGPDGGLMRDRSEKLQRLLRANAAAIAEALAGEDLEHHVDRDTRTLVLATSDRGSKRATAVVVRAGDGEREIPLEPEITVFGSYRDARPLVRLPLPPGVAPADVVGVAARNVHTGAPVRSRASAAPLAGEELRIPRREPVALPPLPAGMVADAARRAITAGPGTIALESTLRLPPGWSLTVVPGTTFEAGPDALLEVRGALAMVGTAEAPVRFRGAGAEDWGALAVVGERTRPVPVELVHVELEGGAGSDAGHARYTGTLSVYFADVRLERLLIRDGKADDAINLKYCTFTATDCAYLDGGGDAVDYDFCEGTDLRTRVERFPDDGIDISGTRARIQDAELVDIGDKGLSLGEHSIPEVVDVRVLGARSACVVKDGGEAVVRGLVAIRCGTALSLYRKKEAFGPPNAHVSGLVAVDVGSLAIVGHRSELVLESSVRVIDEGTPLREFPGVELRVSAGLGGMPRDELADLVALVDAAPAGALR